jgi:hypothetical protein
VGHGWSTFNRNFILVKLKIFQDIGLFSDLFQWICQQVYISLLDVLAFISRKLFCDIGIIELVNDDIFSNLIPDWIFVVLQNIPHLIRNSEGLNGNCIGKSIIINVFSPLISGDNVVDVVGAILVFFDAAFPELSYALDDWSSLLLEPFPILGNAVIFPGSQSNST